jgi:hypothetical protein
VVPWNVTTCCLLEDRCYFGRTYYLHLQGLRVIQGLYNRPEVAAVPSGLSPTPLVTKRKKTYVYVLLELHFLMSMCNHGERRSAPCITSDVNCYLEE